MITITITTVKYRIRERRYLLLLQIHDDIARLRFLDAEVEEGEHGRVHREGTTEEDGIDILREGSPRSVMLALPLLVVVLDASPLHVHAAALDLSLGMFRNGVLPGEVTRNLHSIVRQLELGENARFVHHVQSIHAAPTRLIGGKQIKAVGSGSSANVVLPRKEVIQMVKEERDLGVIELPTVLCVIQDSLDSPSGHLSTASVNSKDDSLRALDAVSEYY